MFTDSIDGRQGCPGAQEGDPGRRDQLDGNCQHPPVGACDLTTQHLAS